MKITRNLGALYERDINSGSIGDSSKMKGWSEQAMLLEILAVQTIYAYL